MAFLYPISNVLFSRLPPAHRVRTPAFPTQLRRDLHVLVVALRVHVNSYLTLQLAHRSPKTYQIKQDSPDTIAHLHHHHPLTQTPKGPQTQAPKFPPLHQQQSCLHKQQHSPTSPTPQQLSPSSPPSPAPLSSSTRPAAQSRCASPARRRRRNWGCCRCMLSGSVWEVRKPDVLHRREDCANVDVVGLTTLTMWYTGAYRAMGLAGLAGVLLAVVDGFVARRLVDGQEAWKHWGAAPIGLGLSGALVYFTA